MLWWGLNDLIAYKSALQIGSTIKVFNYCNCNNNNNIIIYVCKHKSVWIIWPSRKTEIVEEGSCENSRWLWQGHPFGAKTVKNSHPGGAELTVEFLLHLSLLQKEAGGSEHTIPAISAPLSSTVRNGCKSKQHLSNAIYWSILIHGGESVHVLCICLWVCKDKCVPTHIYRYTSYAIWKSSLGNSGLDHLEKHWGKGNLNTWQLQSLWCVSPGCWPSLSIWCCCWGLLASGFYGWTMFRSTIKHLLAKVVSLLRWEL